MRLIEANLFPLITSYFDDALGNNSLYFEQQIGNFTEENNLKIDVIINNITNDFEQRIENNLNETNRNMG